MATSITGAGSAAPLDPAAWLADWTDNGGVVAHTGERLWLGRCQAIDRGARQALNQLRGTIYRAGAADALAGLLSRERRT